MAKTLLLEVVTPERLVVGQAVDAVTIAGTAGDFTVLPLHIPLLSSLRVGTLAYRRSGKTESLFVRGGFAEVAPDRVLILAEVADLPEEIDVDRARRARDRALARLAAAHQADLNYVRARAALQRAILRIRLSEGAAGQQRGRTSGKPF